jgi:hypothetical protein
MISTLCRSAAACSFATSIHLPGKRCHFCGSLSALVSVPVR